MNPVHLTAPQALREGPHVASHSDQVPYYPNGGVAAPPFLITSPLSHSPGTDPGNGTPNQIIGPPDARWITPRATDTQGRGVPRFKRWPRQFHSEAYNFNSIAVMPHTDQVHAIPSGPGEEQLVNNVHQRTEKAGWSIPAYGEQYEQPIAAASLGTGPVNITDPRSVALALGWGYVGS